MNWIQALKMKYSLQVFRQRAASLNFQHAFLDLSQAQTLGFIVNVNLFRTEDLIALSQYLTHLEDNGKKTVVVELNLNRRSDTLFHRNMRTVFLNPRHINWLGFPSVQKMREINKTGIDILINLDNSEPLTSRFICGFSSARTRVGLEEPGMEMFYDLMVQLPLESDFRVMLNGFEHYLKMLEK